MTVTIRRARWWCALSSLIFPRLYLLIPIVGPNDSAQCVGASGNHYAYLRPSARARSWVGKWTLLQAVFCKEFVCQPCQVSRLPESGEEYAAKNTSVKCSVRATPLASARKLRVPRAPKRTRDCVRRRQAPRGRCPDLGQPLPSDTHGEDIPNELVSLTKRARRVVAIGSPVKDPGHVTPVGDAHTRQRAPFHSTPLVGERPVTVITLVIGVSDRQGRPRARAYFWLRQLALERHSVTIGVSDENIEACLAGLAEKTNLELKFG